MALEKGGKFIASEYADYQTTHVTKTYSETPSDDLELDPDRWDKTFWTRSVDPGGDPYYNFFFWTDETNINRYKQYRLRIYNEADTEIFDYTLSEGVSSSIPYSVLFDTDVYVYLAPGKYRMRVDWEPLLLTPHPEKWNTRLYQGQNDMVIGDTIRVWENDFSVFKTLGISEVIWETVGRPGYIGGE